MTTNAPFKTPLGQEELRTRGHKLGQRHRTLLFLIDGRRPLAEVLSLAHQAGAETQHFEDLLRMGLVELPPDPTPPPPPQIPVLTDEAALTSVDIVVVEPAGGAEALAAQPDAAEAMPAAPPPPPVVEVRRIAVEDLPVLRDLPEGPYERTARQPMRSVPDMPEMPEMPVRAVSASPASPVEAPLLPVVDTTPEDPFERTQRLPGPSSADVVAKPPAPRSSPFKMRMGKKPRNVPVLQEPVMPAAPVSASPKATPEPSPTRPRREPARAVPSPVPAAAPTAAPALDIDLPIADGEEARLLQRVRERLTDALRLDAPLFSARTFMRVRSAQSREELINLVWEIQDHLSHRRRSHKELSSLHEARDLLGLGNTLVAGDESRPDYLDE